MEKCGVGRGWLILAIYAFEIARLLGNESDSFTKLGNESDSFTKLGNESDSFTKFFSTSLFNENENLHVWKIENAEVKDKDFNLKYISPNEPRIQPLIQYECYLAVSQEFHPESSSCHMWNVIYWIGCDASLAARKFLVQKALEVEESILIESGNKKRLFRKTRDIRAPYYRGSVYDYFAENYYETPNLYVIKGIHNSKRIKKVRVRPEWFTDDSCVILELKHKIYFFTGKESMPSSRALGHLVVKKLASPYASSINKKILPPITSIEKMRKHFMEEVDMFFYDGHPPEPEALNNNPELMVANFDSHCVLKHVKFLEDGTLDFHIIQTSTKIIYYNRLREGECYLLYAPGVAGIFVWMKGLEHQKKIRILQYVEVYLEMRENIHMSVTIVRENQQPLSFYLNFVKTDNTLKQYIRQITI